MFRGLSARPLAWVVLSAAALAHVAAANAQQPSPSPSEAKTGNVTVTGSVIPQLVQDPQQKIVDFTNYFHVINDISNPTTGRVLLGIDTGADPTGLGASLDQADRAVRAQLAFGNDRGLVISSLIPSGAAAKAGLQANDILTTLDGTPLDKPDDFTAQLKAVGDKTVALGFIRAGKPTTIQIKPEFRITFSAVAPEQTKYYIGVPVKPIDETLRAHLPDLPAGQGLVADGVEPDSPAAKAGMQQSDILLAMGETPITDLDAFVTRIQATGGKTVSVKIVRKGKPMTLEVTPTPRKVDAAANEPGPQPNNAITYLYGKNVWTPVTWDPTWIQNNNAQWLGASNVTLYPNVNFTAAAPDAVEKRLEALDQELKQLRQAIDELRKSLKPEGVKDSGGKR
jgi:membrane-associated protease RseP (regulator of RpoE activity)